MKVYNPCRINRAWRLTIITALLFTNLMCGCTVFPAKTKGVYHRVRSGETLWSIARAYDIKIQELAEANNITDPNLIGLGSVLFIPDADQVVDDVISSVKETGSPVKPAQPEQREAKAHATKFGREESPPNKVPVKPEAPAARDISGIKTEGTSKKEVKDVPARKKVDPPIVATVELPKQDTGKKVDLKANGAEADKIRFDKDRFVWPVKGKVRAKFGIQPNGMYYNGIKIAARENAPIVAAASGIVIFSGPLKDYGETIIIKHEDNYATVYTNLNNRVVKVDDAVRKGSLIAILGKSQKKGEVLLSFEIRYKNKARNPLFFLP